MRYFIKNRDLILYSFYILLKSIKINRSILLFTSKNFCK